MDNWVDLFNREIEQGFRARQNGSEGRARVCARRAAGIVAAAYLDRLKIQRSHHNAITNFNLLYNYDGISAEIKEIIRRLLMRVDANYNLPEEIDLLSDAVLLKEKLFRPEQ